MVVALAIAASGTSYGTISISNIASLVSIRLDMDIYLLWESFLFSGQKKLLKYIDGIAHCLEKFLKDKDGMLSSIVNPAFEVWIEQDALLLLWINATLTPQVLQRVVGLQSSCEVW